MQPALRDCCPRVQTRTTALVARRCKRTGPGAYFRALVTSSLTISWTISTVVVTTGMQWSSLTFVTGRHGCGARQADGERTPKSQPAVSCHVRVKPSFERTALPEGAVCPTRSTVASPHRIERSTTAPDVAISAGPPMLVAAPGRCSTRSCGQPHTPNVPAVDRDLDFCFRAVQR